jgi:hypothetical protein
MLVPFRAKGLLLGQGGNQIQMEAGCWGLLYDWPGDEGRIESVTGKTRSNVIFVAFL